MVPLCLHQTIVLANVTQQILRVYDPIKDQGRVRAPIQLIKKRVNQCRLARTDLPRQNHKPLARLDPISKLRKGLAVTLTEVEKTRIGRYVKRGASKPEMLLVNGLHGTSKKSRTRDADGNEPYREDASR